MGGELGESPVRYIPGRSKGLRELEKVKPEKAVLDSAPPLAQLVGSRSPDGWDQSRNQGKQGATLC